MDKTVTFQPQGRGLTPSGVMKKNTDFGPYHILEHLDRGGMGDVYKARHNKMERIVALKVLPVVLSSQEYLDRFNSEAFSISRLQHQNVVTIYDYGEINHRRFIAMQYITGYNLTDLIEKKSKLSYGQIIDIAKQICRGLQSLHNKGIIHRDIKSSNIMIDQDHRAFISDFGIAQTPGETRLTTTGMAMGTPEYMSPEQCQGHKINEQSDIYSFGVVLYEMITGRPPFVGENPLSIAYKQVHESPSLLSKVKKGVPPRIELIVAKCLKKDKNERYKNAGELLQDMDSIQNFSAKPINDTNPTKIVPVENDQRITDRRATHRRHIINGRLNLSAFILPAIAVVMLIIYSTLQLSSFFEESSTRGRWINPVGYSIPAPLQNPDPGATSFNGEGFFLEVVFDKTNPGTFILDFDSRILAQGLTFESKIVVTEDNKSAKPIRPTISLKKGDRLIHPMKIKQTAKPELMGFTPQLTQSLEFQVSLEKGKHLKSLSGPVLLQLQNIRVLGSEYMD